MVFGEPSLRVLRKLSSQGFRTKQGSALGRIPYTLGSNKPPGGSVTRVVDGRYPGELFHQVSFLLMPVSRKITVAIQAIVRGASRANVGILIDSHMQQSRSTPGLYIIRLILKENATHHETDFLYQVTDLQRASVHNGDLEQFLNAWGLVIGGMRSGGRPPQRTSATFSTNVLKRLVHCPWIWLTMSGWRTTTPTSLMTG